MQSENSYWCSGRRTLPGLGNSPFYFSPHIIPGHTNDSFDWNGEKALKPGSIFNWEIMTSISLFKDAFDERSQKRLFPINRKQCLFRL